uniref:Uncharacterized protein n=1 Tax=Caulobacter phage BL57 TaxID=3348355 RepID=A0AB74UNE6_9VIRU
MIRYIQRHGAFIFPMILIGTGMNLFSAHAVWTDRVGFFVVAVFPAALVWTFITSLRDGEDLKARENRRRSLATKAHALVWDRTLQHPDLQRGEDPNGDWMRLLLAPSGSAIKMLSEQPLTDRMLNELSGFVDAHGTTLLHLSNLNLIPNNDPTWLRINALAAALSEREFDAHEVVVRLASVENALSDAIPAPANLQQEPA